MASRLDVQARREALYESLKRACLDGSLAPGVMLPAVRELGERHGVSANVVFGVIQSLTEEGVLYTVPRVGAFVGRPPRETVELYLMLVPMHDSNRTNYWMQAQSGFEDRIAQLGGHSLILTPAETETRLRQSNLPPLSGIFESNRSMSSHLFAEADVARVFFGPSKAEGEDADRIGFDDRDGGAQATRHLWQNGHRSIAFLGLHGPGETGRFDWSAMREVGWQKALQQMGGEAAGLAFCPPQTSSPNVPEQVQTARRVAAPLVGRTDISAVVAVNANAAQGMFEAFREAGWPSEKWPAVVCFDTAPQTGRSVISYLRLPWEEIGREAAQVLWERRTGRLEAGVVQRLVPMRLIPRLSCRTNWAASLDLVPAGGAEASR